MGLSTRMFAIASWDPSALANFMKSLEALNKLQGGKKGIWSPGKRKDGRQDQTKGLDSGRSSSGPEGWRCASRNFYNFSHRSMCLSCNSLQGCKSPALGGKTTFHGWDWAT
eukprot:3847586-Amphidinium_carterae.1